MSIFLGVLGYHLVVSFFVYRGLRIDRKDSRLLDASLALAWPLALGDLIGR